MIPVYQEKYSNDCLRACLASILEIALDQVPQVPCNEEQVYLLNDWLKKEHGVFIITVAFKSESLPEFIMNDSYMIAAVPSPSGHHAVVTMNGEIVHDPIKDNVKIDPDSIVAFDMLVKLFPKSLNQP